MQCIGATTLDEYRKYIEKDSALKRRFTRLEVPEPTVDETIEILKGLCIKYEKHHNVKYTEEALVAAARLSNQYIRLGYGESNCLTQCNFYCALFQQNGFPFDFFRYFFYCMIQGFFSSRQGDRLDR